MLTTEIANRIDRAFRPQKVERLTLPMWADTYRHLSGYSATSGQWKTSRVEAARGPMLAVNEPGVRIITVACCTQLLKTELILNVAGYFAHQRPGPLLIVQPKDAAARNFSRERITSLIEHTPVLSELFDRPGATNSIQFKEFPGGFLAIEGAGSPMNLASRAVRVTLLDEIDKYEPTKEGDAVLLAEARTATFGSQALNIRVCSPTTIEESRIWASFLDGDQRRPHIACPHCGEEFSPMWKHVEWPRWSHSGDHNPNGAWLQCPANGCIISEAERRAITQTEGAIRYYQTKEFTCDHCADDVPQRPWELRNWRWDERNQVGRAVCKTCGRDGIDNSHASFTCSKILSPHDDATLPALASKWLLTSANPATKQVFYNSEMGEPYSAAEAGAALDVQALMDAREDFAKLYGTTPDGRFLLPPGTLVITGGCDVQQNRLELSLYAIGGGYDDLPLEMWLLTHEIFSGDTSQPAVWSELDWALLNTDFVHPLVPGRPMRVRAVAIDAGFQADVVHSFCEQRADRNLWPIKGSSTHASDKDGDPIWLPSESKVSRDRASRKPQLISTTAAKERLAAMIEAGCVHFSTDVAFGFLSQVCSERPFLEKRGMSLYRRWRKVAQDRAGEALDCLVYSLAALSGLRATRRKNQTFTLAGQAAIIAKLSKEG